MKLSSKKGFTLMEMLIVVGIIAVLVAVSIPVFTNQIEKSREAADVANMRSAKSAAIATYLTDAEGKTFTKYYDAAKGVLESKTDNITGYGKGTAVDGKTATYAGYTNTNSYEGQIIKVVVNDSGEATVSWEAKAN